MPGENQTGAFAINNEGQVIYRSNDAPADQLFMLSNVGPSTLVAAADDDPTKTFKVARGSSVLVGVHRKLFLTTQSNGETAHGTWTKLS